MTAVHGAAALTLGGPLAAACTTCQAPRLHDCHTAAGATCPPHAARRKAAPPVEVAAAGDLVAVDVGGGRSSLALLDDVRELAVQVRLYLPGRKAFAAPKLLPRSAVLRRAIAPAQEVNDAATAARS